MTTDRVAVPIACFDDALRAYFHCRAHWITIDRFVIAHDDYPALRRDPRLHAAFPFPAGRDEQLLNIPLQRVHADQLPAAFPHLKE